MTDAIKKTFYSDPSFVKGTARTVSIFGGLDEYVTSASPKDADAKAIRSDWEAVGKDLLKAIDTYGKTHKK